MSTKRSHILKETCRFQLQVCLSMCDFLVDPGTKGLMAFRKFCVLWNLTHNEDYWIYRAWYLFTVLGLKFVEKKELSKTESQLTREELFPILKNKLFVDLLYLEEVGRPTVTSQLFFLNWYGTSQKRVAPH